MEQSKSHESSQPTEVERKFVIDFLPEGLEISDQSAIRQGYLAVADDGSEVRLRDSDALVYTLTIKSKGDMIRNEYEVPVSKALFDALWPATAGRRIEKTRYKVPYETSLIEIDVYAGELAGLVIAEAEFQTIAEAQSFSPPDWFGREVTSDNSFKNQSLASFGSRMPNSGSE